MTSPHPRKRLLVVDDDPGIVEFLTESLEERGFDVTGLASPLQALERLRAEPFDLVISDIEMPGLRGTELMASIHQARPEQLVLLITAFGSVELAVAAVKAGACDFVTKPFQIEALVYAVERAFEDRQMRREIVRLRRVLTEESPGELVAQSPAMRKALEMARRASRSDATVLLTGETGTGKTALARFIHDAKPGTKGQFVQLNCATLPAQLVESELFGVVRGAYTDAREDRPGLLVAASGGTLLLDEIGELPLEGQAKLLHALETGTVRPVGAVRDTAVQTRIIAATNRPLELLLQEGRFRPDLYYRLNVIRIELPPLRERREDLLPLVDRFLTRASARQRRQVLAVSAAATRKLLSYSWPGNLRELANLLERAVAMGEHDTLVPEDLDFPEPPGRARRPARVERRGRAAPGGGGARVHPEGDGRSRRQQGRRGARAGHQPPHAAPQGRQVARQPCWATK